MKILILVAHTDDETIGCGGTIFKHFNNRDKIFAASFTDGVSSRNRVNQEKIRRKKQSIKVSKILGFNWINQYSLPDNSLDQIPILKIIKKIEKIKKKINPDIVYTHSKYDLNIDHRTIFQSTLTAFRPQPKDNSVEIRCMEIPSATDYGDQMNLDSFKPNLFVDIKKFWKKKQDCLEVYKDELRKYPHSRSIKAIKNLSMSRGSQVGIEMAESFEVIRKIL